MFKYDFSFSVIFPLVRINKVWAAYGRYAEAGRMTDTSPRSIHLSNDKKAACSRAFEA